MGGGAGVVRHHHDGLAQVVHRLAQEAEDLEARARVEVAGRLVREDQLGSRGERPRAGHALLLAAGELRGTVLEPVAAGPACR